ncbi:MULTISPECIES: hypothetical protein [Niallia]|jgi:hypothetical protein|uniref:Uncharacterized protein n=1 Tax=Niallia circulans TaxID=1397 RepID=A0A268FIR0_NIACI|nr:hypothetical protein [Niallia circulans]AYV66315.1 hypothetical protein C2I06_05200 [Niallia circulans]AYV70866.1 hypothetical protein C2H98_04375 [Niallia circulans]NRG30048.1 hypothetical protein [Niallia circulans]PAD85262.1 hypothetical protein CHH57_00900 [Niallia circulans]QJX62198.1 hypothetical protein HLK66_11415 [Niallia circulans]
MKRDKEEKLQKQKMVQELYRERVKQKSKDKNDNRIGKLIVNLCIVVFFVCTIMAILFDWGVKVPQFFGI